LSLYANTELKHDAYVSQVSQRLAELGVAAHVVFSRGEYLDLLPKGVDGNAVDKGGALLHCGDYLAMRDQLDSRPRLIFAGDSENDIGGFRAAIQAEGYGIVPANAHPDFKQWAQTEFGDSVHIARQPFAAGVQEGFEHFTRIR
jgi:hydroxymethylpyrimidine pyrophosphatase-like HAD family hydrolase